MYIDKRQLVTRIKDAAITYQQYLVGQTYMFVYDQKKIEVIFKVDSFMHLTGVASTLKAKDFYKKAVRKSLKASEIKFDSKHPADFADIKTRYIKRLYELTITDIFIAEDILTMTATYAFGMTNLEFVLCCGKNTDKAGNVIDDCYVPYSFRVEEIDNGKFQELFEVDYIFKKSTNQNKYPQMTFGNTEKVKFLDQEIKDKLENCLIEE
ncbi:MAG: PBECR4 domain-containing protein [Lachnospiraceae bacterium]|nr:PBECR4 domain-containing protein [Lachnospiraceae bacterium]